MGVINLNTINLNGGSGGGSAEGAVKYTEAQSLTDAQKTQARTNIGAASDAELTSLEQNVGELETTVAGHTTSIASLQSEIDSFIGAQTNFVGIVATSADLPTVIAPSWGLVGADIDALNAYVWNGTSWAQFGTKTYDFTDFSGLKQRVNQLEVDVNGGVIHHPVSKVRDISSLRIATTGKVTTSTACSCCNFEVTPAKTYHLILPLLSDTHTVAYGFRNVDTIPAGGAVTLPSTVVVGPVNNGEYDILVPDGMTHLLVSYEASGGSPTLSYSTQETGLVDDIEDLDDRVSALEEQSADIGELQDDMYGNDSEVTLTPVKTVSLMRLAITGTISSSESCSLSNYKVEGGKTYRISVPHLISQYTAVYGFKNVDTIAAGASYAPTENPVVGPVTDGEYEVIIPEGYDYLLVCYETADGVPTVVTTIHTDGVKADVAALKQKMKDDTMQVSVPDVINAVVGDTLQLYYKSIFRCVDPYIYDIKVTCDVGAQYPRYYEIKPTAEQIGEHAISFVLKNNNGETLGTKEVILNISNKVTSPNLNILCVGASNTVKGEWVSELHKRLTTNAGTPTIIDGQTVFTPKGFSMTGVHFVGRKAVTFGGQEVHLEATGGYNFNSYISTSEILHRFNFTGDNPFGNASVGDVYSFNGHDFTIKEINITDNVGNISCTSSYTGSLSGAGTLVKVSGEGDDNLVFASSSSSGNPFVYDGQVDIQQYADDYCNGQIDVVYTELFGNGLVNAYQELFPATFSSMMTFINQFRSVFPACKFCLNIMQNKDEKGGLGVNYKAGTSAYAYPYGMKYGCHNLLVELQKYITDNNLSDYVFIVNTLNEFDCENNYRQTMRQVNPRSSVKEVFGVNGVHPADIGYFQMADSAVRTFIANLCQ